jgi:hypothetical protein
MGSYDHLFTPNLILYILVHITFVFYIPEDGHVVGRKMLEVTVCVN